MLTKDNLRLLVSISLNDDGDLVIENNLGANIQLHKSEINGKDELWIEACIPDASKIEEKYGVNAGEAVTNAS